MVSNDGFPLDIDWVEKIHQFAYKKTRNTEDAQDLSQEIIVQVLHAMNRGAEPNNFHAWVWSIARNHWYKYLERKQKETRLVRVEGGQISPIL